MFPLPPLSFRSAVALRRSVVFAVGIALSAGGAWADRNDRLQPLNFASDHVRVEDNQRLNILTGNVEITKGTILLKADRVEIRQKADASQSALATGGTGGRAFFRQRREGLNEFIEGEAERIEYDSASDEVNFLGRAVMRRFNGNVVADEVNGQTIVYDNRTEVFQVKGGPKLGPTTGRVRGVISPRSDAAPASAPSAAPGQK